jgi:uncharacterized protein (DUF952 family)
MHAKFIYHMCPKSDWAAAVTAGVYHGRELDRRDGFIHFSSPDQVRETAALHLSGATGLVLLQIEASRLGAALKWEKSRDNGLFPHLYGPMDPDHVDKVFDLPLNGDGQHVFPDIG